MAIVAGAWRPAADRARRIVGRAGRAALDVRWWSAPLLIVAAHRARRHGAGDALVGVGWRLRSDHSGAEAFAYFRLLVAVAKGAPGQLRYVMTKLNTTNAGPAEFAELVRLAGCPVEQVVAGRPDPETVSSVWPIVEAEVDVWGRSWVADWLIRNDVLDADDPRFDHLTTVRIEHAIDSRRSRAGIAGDAIFDDHELHTLHAATRRSVEELHALAARTERAFRERDRYAAEVCAALLDERFGVDLSPWLPRPAHPRTLVRPPDRIGGPGDVVLAAADLHTLDTAQVRRLAELRQVITRRLGPDATLIVAVADDGSCDAVERMLAVKLLRDVDDAVLYSDIEHLATISAGLSARLTLLGDWTELSPPDTDSDWEQAG